VVQTNFGRLRGSAEGQVYRFAGIPFAAPPVGERRFAAPARPESWSGVRPAVEFGPASLQHQQPPAADPMFAPQRVDEDCLTLNVWTPDPGAAGLPVIAYIHGGGLIGLSGADPTWHGDTFARDGFVFVTLNYRLGALGYLYLDELVPGADGSSANGVLDQLAALRWIHENIAAFGGDPGCVTVMGQSAGGWSVATLIASPLADGLLHRAVIQSGGGHHVRTASIGTRVTRQYLRLAGLDADLDALRQAPAERLYAAQEALQGILAAPAGAGLLGDDVVLQMPFLPVPGTAAVPAVPHVAVAAGAGHRIDLMAGSNRDEYGLYRLIGAAQRVEVMRRNAHIVLHRAGRRADDVEQLYRKDHPGWADNLVAEAMETDRFYRVPVLRMAEGHSGRGGRTYVYEFAYANSEFGAGHCGELPFVFQRPDCALVREMTSAPAPAKLSDAMHAAWAAFARAGRPQAPGLPAWPEFDTVTRQTMVFDFPDCTVEADPRGNERTAWEGVI
jgi:para-nitrobenzyl esterase